MRIFRRRNTEPELDSELRYHLDKLIAGNLLTGMSPEEARRQALIEFGGIEPFKEGMRDIRPASGLQSIAMDIRYGMRRLRRAPAFAAVAILSLALGIGANTAIFSLVNAVLLRLIPVERPADLVWLTADPYPRMLNYPFFEHIRNDPRFSGLLCVFATPVNVTTNNSTERLNAELVSGSYFSTLGLRPHLGRLLSPDDDRERLGHYVAVVSHAFWQSRMAGDAKTIGRSIHINGAAYTVVGVAPPGFDGIERGFTHSVFVPVKMKPQITPGWDGLDKPLVAWLGIMGRLKPGVDREQLGRELHERFHAFQKPYLETERRLSAAQRKMIVSRQLKLETLRDASVDLRVRTHLATLAWIVAALLLLACVNVAGLLLARGLERHREIATRLSIGATRSRVVRQLLIENLMLGVAGGVAGLVLGIALAPLLASRFPIAGRMDTTLDLRVLAFASAVSIASVLAFGLVPALHATRLDLVSSMKGAVQAARGRRLRLMLLSGQVAVALVLLAAAGLFSANLRRLLKFDVGFASRQLVIAEMEPMLLGYDDARRLKLYRGLEDRLAQAAHSPASGFTEAALSNVAPMSQYWWSSLFIVEGRPDEKDFIPRAVAVSPGYFATLRIPLRRGRMFTGRDDERAPKVALISESLARRFFPDSDPIGRRFTADLRKRAESQFEIVGVVADIHLNDPRRRENRECVYLPYRQSPFVPQAVVIQARLSSESAASAATATLRRAVRDVDPNMALYDIRTIEDAVDSMLNAERLVTLLSTLFAALAGLLAAIGLHGILAREVAVRAREIGIRMALGASPASLLRALLRDAALFCAAGAAVGFGLLWLLRPLLQPLLVDVKPTEPAVLLAAFALLAISTALGSLLPGRKATRIEPAAALRSE